MTKFNQNTWLHSHIDMNFDLRNKEKNDFEKYIFKLINNSVFRKALENLIKHQDIRLVTTEKRRNHLVSVKGTKIYVIKKKLNLKITKTV